MTGATPEGARSGAVAGQLLDLGRCGYRDAHARQLELLGERQRGERPDTLVLVEHPHVITLGRRQSSQANVVAAGGVEVVQIERGGDVTYHGPGQLVAYPIVLLGDGERDLHRFLRNLEEAMIRTLAHFGVRGGRNPGATGVWIGVDADGAPVEPGPPRKIASIGIACRKWVTFHGLALNVNTDLGYFQRINPCGFESSVMTSMARELGHELALGEVKAQLARDLGDTLGRRFA